MNALLLAIAAFAGWYAVKPKPYLGLSSDPNWKIGKVNLK